MTGFVENDFCKRIFPGGTTSRLALAFPQLNCWKRLFLVVKLSVTLSRVPTALPTTSTVKVAVPPIAISSVKPVVLYDITLVPGTAVKVPIPVFVEDALDGEAMTISAGKLSVKVMPSTFPVFAVLSIVKVNVLRSPRFTDAGLKLLKNPGRLVATVKLAEAVPLFPALEVKSPVVLVCVPEVVLVTFTLIVHEVPEVNVPSLTVIVELPATAVTVAPEQSFIITGGSATVIPTGRLSVKAISVTPVPEPELSIVKVKVLTLPGPISFGLKDFENAGGSKLKTSTSSVAEFPPTV